MSDDIESAVKTFILTEFLPGEDPAELTMDTPLITGGILDSIATLKLVHVSRRALAREARGTRDEPGPPRHDREDRRSRPVQAGIGASASMAPQSAVLHRGLIEAAQTFSRSTRSRGAWQRQRDLRASWIGCPIECGTVCSRWESHLEIASGFYLRKSIDAVASLYGVLKAGAAYVPVDPGAPRRAMRSSCPTATCESR